MELHKEFFSVSSRSISQFLKIYFDFSYHLCLSPFRLKLKDRQFIIHNSNVQRVITAVLCILTVPWLIRSCRRTPSNPTDFLKLMHSVVNTFLKLSIMLNFWQNSKKILTILNFIVDNMGKIGEITQQKLKTKRIALAISFLLTLVSSLQIFGGKNLGMWSTDVRFSNWNAYWWQSRIITAGRYNFGLERNFTKLYLGAQGIYSSMDHIVGVLSALGFIAR